MDVVTSPYSVVQTRRRRNGVIWMAVVIMLGVGSYLWRAPYTPSGIALDQPTLGGTQHAWMHQYAVLPGGQLALNQAHAGLTYVAGRDGAQRVSQALIQPATGVWDIRAAEGACQAIAPSDAVITRGPVSYSLRHDDGVSMILGQVFPSGRFAIVYAFTPDQQVSGCALALTP